MTRAVVIVAAGNGSRMGQRDKALLPIGGEPAIVHSIRAAAAAEGVGWIVVVTRDDLLDEVMQIVSDLEIEQMISVVTGGPTRVKSVEYGLLRVEEYGADFVAVHDAARPLVTTAMFNAVFAETESSYAAIVAVRIADTIKRVDDSGRIEETIDRTGLWAAQTPQAFSTGLLLYTLRFAERNNLTGTDEAYLYEILGRDVTVVPGDVTNLKLTYPGDEDLANFLFERRRAKESEVR